MFHHNRRAQLCSHTCNRWTGAALTRRFWICKTGRMRHFYAIIFFFPHKCVMNISRTRSRRGLPCLLPCPGVGPSWAVPRPSALDPGSLQNLPLLSQSFPITYKPTDSSVPGLLVTNLIVGGPFKPQCRVTFSVADLDD